MNRSRSITCNVACFSLALLLLFMRPAHAYLDLGTASYAFQVGVAALLGVLVTAKYQWKRISTVLRRLFARKAARDDR